MRRGSIALIVLLGCAMVLLRGGIDIDRQAFVISMGIDRETDGRLRLSLQIPSAKTSSNVGAEETAENLGGYQLIDSIAWTIQDALELLRTSIPRQLNFSQVLQVIVSETVAAEPAFAGVLEGLLTADKIRQAAAVIVCHGDALAFIKAQKPVYGLRLSEDVKISLDLFYALDRIPDSCLGEVIRDGAWGDLLLPYAVVTPQGENQLDVKTPRGRPLDTLDALLPPTQDTHIEYLGAAVFKDGSMVGMLTGMEMRFISYLRGAMHEFTFCADGVYYRVQQVLPAHTSVDTTRPQWKLTVTGNIRVSLLYSGRMDLPGVQDAFTYEAVSVLQKLQAMGVDPLSFQGKAVRSSWTLADWAETDWPLAYQNAVIEVRTRATAGEPK